MSAETPNPKNGKTFSQWLEGLQQESWQLELIITSILLLVLSNYDQVITEWANRGAIEEGWGMFLVLLEPILLFFKSNLIVHILLRGLWIGCLGLRYLSKETDFEQLNYSALFTNFLKKRVISFDAFIQKLEDISSIIFSFTFLIVFHFLSAITILFMVVLLTSFFRYFFDAGYSKIIGQVLFSVFAVSVIINFLDFILVGFFKKNKWLSYLFYPFFRIYNLFTFSFLYRPLHYNFLNSSLGKRYMFLMVPYIFFLLLISEGFAIGSHPFLPSKIDNRNWILEPYYDDLRNDDVIKIASIPSINITQNHLKLFLRYHDKAATNAVLTQICPHFSTYKRNSIRLNAFGSAESVEEVGREKIASNQHNKQADEAMNCLAQLFDIRIDDLEYQDLDFVLYQHPNRGEKGLLTYIPLDSLAYGKHQLIIQYKEDYEAENFVIRKVEVPFFKL